MDSNVKKKIVLYDRFDPVSFANMESHEENVWTNAPDDPDACVVFNGTIGSHRNLPTSLIMTEPYDVILALTRVGGKKFFYDMCESEDFPFNHVFSYDSDLVKHRPDRVKKIFPGTPTWIPESDRKIHDKTKNVSMITSRKNFASGHSVRVGIADFLSQSGLIDLYGKDYGVPVETKTEALADYRFSVVVENEVINGWHTEKILDCFMTGTVPIYYGDPEIGSLYDTHGIISLVDFFGSPDPHQWNLDKFELLNEEMYMSMMGSVKSNLEMAIELNPKYHLRTIIDQICEESFS